MAWKYITLIIWKTSNKRGLQFALIVFCLLAVLSVKVAPRTNAPENALTFTDSINVLEAEAKMLEKRWNGEYTRRSIELYLEAAGKWKELSNFRNSSNCFRNIARLDMLLGDNDKAISDLNNALDIDRQAGDADGEIKTLSLLSQANLRLGKMDEAKRYAEKALTLNEASNDTDAKASALFSQAQIDYDTYHFDESVAEFEKAAELWRMGGFKTELAYALIGLSYVHMTRNDLWAGIKKADEAREIFIDIGDVRGRTLAQIAKGIIGSKLGDKQTALNIFLNSEQVYPSDMDYGEKGVMYNHLARIYEEYGDLKTALNYHLKAFELYKIEQNEPAQVAVLPSLGILTFKLGEEETGLHYFDSGFELAKKTGNKYFYAILSEELGNLYLQKDPKASVKYFKQALVDFKELKIEKRIAPLQRNLGVAYRLLGNTSIAKRYFLMSLGLSGELKDKFTESQVLYDLARISAEENNILQALALAKTSVEKTDSLYSGIANSQLKNSYLSNAYDRYELYIHLLMAMHEQHPDEGFAIQALELSEKDRARSMRETIALSDAGFTGNVNTDSLKREKELRNLLTLKSDEMTDLSSKKREQSKINKCDDEINELTAQLESVKAEIKESNPLYSAVNNPVPFDITEFQNNVLDDNTLLLEFSLGKDESYLWVIDKNKVTSYTLPGRDRIESGIDKLREILTSYEISNDESIEDYQARKAGLDQYYWREAQTLSSDILGPAADQLNGKRLIVVAEGKMHYFPLSVLPLPNFNKNEPLLLTNEVIYEPSASTLSLLVKNEKQIPDRPKDLLIFSDPVFSNNDSRLSTEMIETDNSGGGSADKFRFAESLNSLQRLSGSKMESDSITGIISPSSTDIFTGFLANRQQLLDLQTAEYKIIHFATHGLINENHPELSGIVFSRFNEKREKLEQLLRVPDIYALRIKADLVVLSACNTGVGKEVKGEGLTSLNNAFLGTGAKTVVSTLWKVEDSATVELMKNFYESMAGGGLSPSKALHTAQIKMWQNGRYRSPFYWGAFTIQGSLNKPMVLSGDRPHPFAIFFIIAVLVAAAYYIYSQRKTPRS